MVILPLAGASSAADAAQRKAARVSRPVVPAPEKDAAIVIDGATGKLLYARNPDAIRYPASLTKMMTLYLLFEALDKSKIHLDTQLITSVHAAEQEPTKLAMGPGAAIPVETAIKALTVLSANDVAVVIAEALGGTEDAFGLMMTEKAHELGMSHTNFHNASGLPDMQQLTTARDMALLARHLAYDFPQYYHYFSAPGFSYGNRSYVTHDNLLAAFGGTDGIKTGYTQLSGFNLVTSVVRNNKHVIGVVMGGPTAAVRDREMMRLLSATFEVAKSDPDMLADADVPWKGGKGPEGDIFKAIQGDDSSLLLAALEPKSKGKLTSKVPPVLVAQAKIAPAGPVPGASSGLIVVPIPKGSSEVYPAATAPVLSHETEAIETPPATVQPPLQFDPAPAEQIADAAVAVAQGDGDSVADIVENANPAPAIAAPAVSVPTPPPVKAVRSVPVPAAVALANLVPANPVLAGNSAVKPAAVALANLVPANPVLAGNSAVKQWAVQIGAFASETLARAKLAVFARSGFDIIGQAQKLVVPFMSGGHIMYRARLGMFAESEARDICKRMEQRGQSCFVAPADAG